MYDKNDWQHAFVIVKLKAILCVKRNQFINVRTTNEMTIDWSYDHTEFFYYKYHEYLPRKIWEHQQYVCNDRNSINF